MNMFINDDENHLARKLHDTLEYYQKDVAWFSYMFAMLVIHLYMMIRILATDEYKNYKDYKLMAAYSIVMVIGNIAKLVLLMPLRTTARELKIYSWPRFLGILLYEVVGIVLFFILKSDKDHIVSALSMIEVMVFVGQFIEYKLQTAKYLRDGYLD